MWLVGVVSRWWVWLVGVVESMGVVSRRWVWVESMGVASGCGCKEVDFVILLIPTPLVSSFFKNKHKPIYACFVDIEKAFDSIKNDLLWNKLAAMGVSKKKLNLLQSMYQKASCRVTSKQYSLFIFPCNKGVRQG